MNKKEEEWICGIGELKGKRSGGRGGRSWDVLYERTEKIKIKFFFFFAFYLYTSMFFLL